MHRLLSALFVLTVLLAAGALLAGTPVVRGSRGKAATPAATHAATAPANATPTAAPAQDAKAGKAAAADDGVEEVEAADVTPVVETSDEVAADAGSDGWEDLAGRFHTALVHLPIGWLLMVLLLDVLAFAMRRKDLEASGLWVLGATLLSFAPACATGLMREDFVGRTPEVRALIETHQALIFTTIGIVSAAFLWRLWFRRNLSGPRKGVYLALVVGASVMVAFGGHWGGKVAWGPDYLPF